MPEKIDLVSEIKKKYPATLIDAVCFLDFFRRHGYKSSEMRIGLKNMVIFRLVLGDKVHEEHIGKPELPDDKMKELWNDLTNLWVSGRKIEFKRKAEIYRDSIVSSRESEILAKLSVLEMDEPLVTRWRNPIRKRSGALVPAIH